MIHRCQVWVVNAVLGRDRIAENTLQPPPPHQVFRVPENPPGSYITAHLQLHLFPSSCFIVHIQPCCRQRAGDGTAGFVHWEDPADFISHGPVCLCWKPQIFWVKRPAACWGFWLELIFDGSVLFLLSHTDQMLLHRLLQSFYWAGVEFAASWRL